jgi:hypothetical protein
MKRILIDGKPSRVVPVEPSEAMKRVGGDTLVSHLRSRDGEYIDENSAGDVCSAMLAASDPALTEAVAEMRGALTKAERALAALLSFYGQNLQVHGWHQNGDPEPLDSFIDSNTDGAELSAARAALARITVPAPPSVEAGDAG